MGSPRTLGIPVPWVFTIAYLVGVGVQFAAPVSASGVLLLASVAAGVLLIVGGTALASWGRLFSGGPAQPPFRDRRPPSS